MNDPWKADRHPDGWAVYRTDRGAREAFRLRADPAPVIFERQRAAAVWAEILNEFRKAER